MIAKIVESSPAANRMRCCSRGSSLRLEWCHFIPMTSNNDREKSIPEHDTFRKSSGDLVYHNDGHSAVGERPIPIPT